MGIQESKLTIGVLGMPDNETTPKLLKHLANNNISVDFVIYWKPSMKDQYKRFIRKLRFSGIFPTIQRISYALLGSKITRQKQDKGRKIYKEYFVSNHTSLECQNILKEEMVDILILATDVIITHEILRIPRLATLNAHPGWIPQFRGLGSLAYQLAKGNFPAVSIHKVDEGVDTGPLILRECLKVDPKNGLSFIEAELDLLRYRLLSKVVRMFERGEVQYIDTFEEPSNVTRGMPLKYRKALDRRLKSGKLKLNPWEKVDTHFQSEFEMTPKC